MDVSFIPRHYKLFLTLSLLTAFFFVSFAPFVQTINNVDYFRLQDHPDQKYYEHFQEVFGNDEFFVIAYEKDDIFTTDNLLQLKDITRQFENLELARDVFSLANVDYIIGDEDYFLVQPFLHAVPQDQDGLELLKRQALNNPLYVGNIISEDGTTAAVAVFAHDRPDDPDYREKLLYHTGIILEPYQSDTQFYLAGWTVTNYSLSQYMLRDLARFIPLTYLLIAVVTFVFFRNVRLTILAVVTISASVGSTMGLFRILDIPINNVTTAVPPLVMALTLTSIVHILTHMQRRVLDRFPDKSLALSHVLNQVAVPCALTALTTAVGFLSLSVSDLEPVKQFSLLASSGIVFGFFYSFFLLPPLIMLFDPRKLYAQVKEDQKLSRLLTALAAAVDVHKRKIIVGNALLILLAVFFAAQIKVETNLVEFFKKTSPERQAIDFVEKRLSGVGLLDVSVVADQRDAFMDPVNLLVLEKLEAFLVQHPGVDKVTSFNHFLKDMNMSFHNEDAGFYRIPDTRQLTAQYLLLYDSDDIDDFINADYDHARIAVRIAHHGSRDKALLIRELRDYIDSVDSPGLSIRVTGHALQDVNVIDALVSGQIYSLSITLGVISILMFAVFKSFSLGLLSLIPNLFPIVLNFGLMGLLGIPLNTATSLIAAMAIGIAVDDTIHFLSHYNKQRSRGLTASRAVDKTMIVKGRALISSSVILCIGFGVLVCSSFIPMIHFGLLSALIMLAALAGDLILLPAILKSRPVKPVQFS